MSRTWNRDWLVGTVLTATLLTFCCSQLQSRVIAADADLGLVFSVSDESDSSEVDKTENDGESKEPAEPQPDATETEDAAKSEQPAENPEPAAEPDAPEMTDEPKSDVAETNTEAENPAPANSDELKLQSLKVSIANELRRNAGVSGVVFGDVTDDTLEATVLVEESAKEQPSAEDLTKKVRSLTGDREVKLDTKPWGAAARLKQLQGLIKAKPELVDVTVVNLFLLGLDPDKLSCQLRGTAKDPSAQDALVVAVTGLVTDEFESPVGKPIVVEANLDVKFDSAPLLKAIQESLARNADLSGLRVEQITSIQDVENSVWKLSLKGDSPLPLPLAENDESDDVKLVKLVNELLPSVYPKWQDKLQVQTPELADRVPDAGIVLANVQKTLKSSSSDWEGCELTQIVSAPPTEAGGKLIWTLKGKAAHPVKEAQLIDLCQEAVVQTSPWWKRAKTRLDIKSECALSYPTLEPFVTRIQTQMKSDPDWRGVKLKKIDASTSGGDSNVGGPGVTTWSLVGEVNQPDQKDRLMAMVKEEHGRAHPEWKDYSRLRFEEQLKQVPVDPSPVLKVLQDKLRQNFGWDGCNVTGLESKVINKSDADQTSILQILGTVAFASQKDDLPVLATEAFREVYPGWGQSSPPDIDPNSVKIVHPSAKSLLTLIQHDLERMPNFDDCQIIDAVVDASPGETPSNERLDLKLIGRTTRPAQQRALVSLDQFPSLKKSYGKKAVDGEAAQIRPNPSDIEVVKGSQGLASAQFEIGQDHYVHRDFYQAKAAFAAAMFENASNLNYQLWHVAMCLASGEEALAHDRLLNIMKERRAEFRRHDSEAFHVAMTSLERLQGPLRRQLEELEKLVLSEITSAQSQVRR